MTLKWHILTDDHSYTMLFEGGTPLNNPPIEIHANSSMFALIFWPHVTIFCIFWLHECLKWILEFNSKSLFWCQSRQTFEVRAIEQRHHEFQLIHMPPHRFWPRYHSDGLSPVHVRFECFSKQICNVEALICHFYKNIKTLTQIHFPRDAHIFRTCTIFYRHYKGLHQMRKDLVLCALWRDFLNFFFIFRILGQNQEKVSFLVDLRCSKVTKQAFIEWRCSQKSAYFGSFKHLRNTTTLLPICWCFLNFKMTKNSFMWKKKK